MSIIFTVSDGPIKGTYITLPREAARLYAEFSHDGLFRLPSKRDYMINCSASQGVRRSGLEYRGGSGAKALFKIAPRFYRNPINPDEIQRFSIGLEKYLDEENNIDVSDESVRTVAEEIKSQLPSRYREHPYAIIEGILGWVADNIESVIAPPHVLETLTEIIDSLPIEQRHDPFVIWKSYGLEEGVFENLGNFKKHHLPDTINDSRRLAEASCEVLWYADPNSYAFFWILPGESAKTTIRQKWGKCIGITNVYVALARTLGVPSSGVDGVYDLLTHSWAKSYLHPYGWVEVEPTFSQFEDFDYDKHAYVFSQYHENLPKLSMLDKESGDQRILEEAIKLLEGSKHKSEIRFLESLRKTRL